MSKDTNNPGAVQVSLVHKVETYINRDTSEKIEYDAFYIDLGYGIVKIKPADATCKSLLLGLFN